jgi:predicted nuclease with TOPRIM domain
MFEAIVVLLSVAVALLIFLVLTFRNETSIYKAKLQRYWHYRSRRRSCSAKQQLEEAHKRSQEAASEDKKRKDGLEAEYKQALSRYEDLKHEVSILEENLEDISFGLYKPHFNFQTPEEIQRCSP